MVSKTVSLLMLYKLEAYVSYYQELLSIGLSRLFALKYMYFSPNILGTTCFVFSPKLRLDHVI